MHAVYPIALTWCPSSRRSGHDVYRFIFFLRFITESPVAVALITMNAIKLPAFVDKIDPRDCRAKKWAKRCSRCLVHNCSGDPAAGLMSSGSAKFHDIPNTTLPAVAAAADPRLMVNVHASGGVRNGWPQRATRWRYFPVKMRCRFIAVTVLTSMETSDLRDLGVTLSPANMRSGWRA